MGKEQYQWPGYKVLFRKRLAVAPLPIKFQELDQDQNIYSAKSSTVPSLPRACPEGCALRFHGFPVKRDTRDWRDTKGGLTRPNHRPRSTTASTFAVPWTPAKQFNIIQHNSTMQGKPSSIQTSKLLSVIHNWRIKSEEIHLVQHNMFYSVIRRHHSHWMHWGGQEMNNMLHVCVCVFFHMLCICTAHLSASACLIILWDKKWTHDKHATDLRRSVWSRFRWLQLCLEILKG